MDKNQKEAAKSKLKMISEVIVRNRQTRMMVCGICSFNKG
ncbi:hypothetical protein D932_01997 [Enterococcus casseliflavus 14-MB-W-14]|nr:hypothetical protein D932_01997 [Enterococcus casseliflavus 14-MB-W-14]